MKSRIVLVCVLIAFFAYGSQACMPTLLLVLQTAVVDESTPEVPPVALLGFAGTLSLTDGDDRAEPVATGFLLDLEQTLTTAADGRAAFEVMNLTKTKQPGEPMHLTIAPETSVGRLTPQMRSDFGPPTVLRLHKGLCRVVAEESGEGAPVTILAGPLKIDVRGADAAFKFEPAMALLTCFVSRGELAIPVGDREIRIRSGMKRLFFGASAKGSSKFESKEWNDLLERMIVPGVAWTDPNKAKEAKPVQVRMVTSKGEIVLQLDPVKAPITVANFLAYLDEGFFDGTIFHRVMRNFMIQGGGYDEQYQKKPTRDPIKNEWENGLKNVRGTISMARMGGMADSATSQFFINVQDNPALDRPQRDGAAYAVFGMVVDGMEVVDAIRTAPVTRSRLNPREQSESMELIVIRKMERVETVDAED